MHWPSLNLSVNATLADDKNPELCQDIWNALPIESVMSNAVITGGSMYCWAPILSYAPLRYKEAIDKAPIGRLRYSQGTGNKIIVQYDKCHEDVMGTVLGEVDAEDIPTIQAIGSKALQSIFLSKQPLYIRISRLEEGAAQEARQPQVNHLGLSPEAVDLVQRIMTEALAANKAETQEHKNMRTGRNKDIGSFGQYFSTWEFVYSMLRDLSMYTLYPLAKMSHRENIDLRQLCETYMEMVPQYTNLLGSYGMFTLRNFTREFEKLIKEKELSRKDVIAIIEALTIYTNCLSAWAYFYYPWGIGNFFRFPEE